MSAFLAVGPIRFEALLFECLPFLPAADAQSILAALDRKIAVRAEDGRFVGVPAAARPLRLAAPAVLDVRREVTEIDVDVFFVAHTCVPSIRSDDVIVPVGIATP